MHTQESLSWDPINVNVNNQEWMNCVVPSLSAQRQSARYAKNDTLPPTSAVQRLRQRREAKAQAAEKATPPATVAEAAPLRCSAVLLGGSKTVGGRLRWMNLGLTSWSKRKPRKRRPRRKRQHSAGSESMQQKPGVPKSLQAFHQRLTMRMWRTVWCTLPKRRKTAKHKEADRLFSEAIHGMFLLATSDARREEEVDPEKPEDDEEDSDGVQKADSMDSQILPDKENFSPVPDKLANEDEDTPEAGMFVIKLLFGLIKAKAEAAEADAEDSSAEEENADVKPEEPKLVRSFADLVAGRPARQVEEEAESAFVSFKADAPEFVPMSMTTPFQARNPAHAAMRA
eukprot:g2461.t1